MLAPYLRILGRCGIIEIARRSLALHKIAARRGIFLNIFVQLLVSLASVSLMFGVFWLVFGTMRTPVRSGQGAEICTIISVHGSADGLEQTLKGLNWLTENGVLVGRIIIADCGLNDDGRELCGFALKKYAKVTLCRAKDVEQWIKQNR